MSNYLNTKDDATTNLRGRGVINTITLYDGLRTHSVKFLRGERRWVPQISRRCFIVCLYTQTVLVPVKNEPT